MIPQIGSPVTFTSQLKNLFKKGKIKNIKGIYGEPIEIKNVSDEHIIPKSLGGSNKQGNIALASKELNNARGNKPITDYVTPQMVIDYLEQFKGIRMQGFNGDKYYEDVIHTFSTLA